MQALKKAERAKQSNLPDEELERPSEAFDDILALEPQNPSAPTAGGLELSLEPLDAPAYTPHGAAAQDAVAAATGPASGPAGGIEPSLAPLDFAPAGSGEIPLVPATEAIHDPVPPQARQEAARPRPAPVQRGAHAPAFDAGASLGAPSQSTPAYSGDTTGAANATNTAGTAGAARAGNSAAQGGTRAAATPRTQAGQQSAYAASGRAGAQQTRASGPRGKDKTAGRIDPAHLRLGILGGILALILIVFGLMYWRALTARPGAALPMVAMPGQGGVPQAAVVVPVPPAGDAGAVSAPGADSTAPAGAPAQPSAPANAAAQPAPVEQRMSPEEAQAAIRAATEREAAELAARLARERVEARRQAQGLAPAPAGGNPSQPAAPATAQSGAGALTPMADSGELRIVRNSAAQQVPPAIQAAYQSFQAGDMAGAGQQYAQALQQDPNNRDALLGSAAVALREQRPAQASAAYLRLLELDPNDGEALAGLSSLRGGDAGQAESRLKAILQRTPESAPVHFALGNLYARQARWPEAQQAFFRAYTGSPSNPDYAFNLAIGLDRLNQGKLAASYYERALALAQSTRASFDQAAVRRRLQELSAAAR
ncbi:tetratricopeptide repeat protein [Pseudoduganella violacea]|uniref:Tfp pilus assembly protein PilF n=1 Tax=Pseudoduganella violacea TaxID=1715466 RepID=A0A7W5BDL8_9BURK|nr:tetratricopeptide repeat protein [Pseudoduganella violacea]MBB3121229.1 Tfp pilus assembly protein PilF [Pseudoduganella violacea]